MEHNRFLVWDGFKKEWATGCFLINQDGELRDYCWENGKRVLKRCDKLRYKIIRATGMKDMYGHMIFERNIVCVYTEMGSDYASFYGEVKEIDGAWKIDDGTMSINLMNEIGDVMIVGSAYENSIEELTQSAAEETLQLGTN